MDDELERTNDGFYHKRKRTSEVEVIGLTPFSSEGLRKCSKCLIVEGLKFSCLAVRCKETSRNISGSCIESVAVKAVRSPSSQEAKSFARNIIIHTTAIVLVNSDSLPYH